MKKVMCVVKTDALELRVGNEYHVTNQYTKEDIVKLKWQCGHLSCLIDLLARLKDGIWYSLAEFEPKEVYHSSAFADLPDPVEEAEDVERELELVN